MPLPPELRVEIRKVGDKFHAVTERAKGQEVCANTFEHDPGKLIHLEPQWMLDRGARLPAEALRQDAGADKGARPPDDHLLIQYGQRLYRYLFGDGQKLKSFLEFNDAYRAQARLTLCLHPDAAELWSLPWEYLHDGQEFLCLNGKLLLSRLPLKLGELSPAEAAPPLRILVVIAGPDDQHELNFERELAVIQDALDDTMREGLAEVDFLDDATFPALQDALSRKPYHVLHYTGHGAYHEKESRGVLCFEDDEGKTDLVGADKLRPLLVGRELRLVVLSACQSAKTGGLQAFDSVATGLLQADLPAALAMQFSVLDDSAIEMARVFYTELARGRSPVEALHQAQQAMRHLDEARAPDARRFDWGVPALYLRAPRMRLIDPAARTVETRHGASLPRDFGGLPLPRVFVGRRPELRQLRRALRDRLPALFVRGIGGVGKSTLAAKLLERPGAPLDDALVIRCHELSLPADALTKLANFWQAQGKAGHAEAAALLLDSRLDPADRARQALQRIANRRYLVVFDNLETWFNVPPSQGGTTGGVSEIADPTLRAILHGLLTARADTTFLFTSRHRWAEVEGLPASNRLEVQLPGLTLRQAVLLMNALPRLKDEPLSDKLAVYQRVGGHPKTIELLDGWLADGRRLRALLDDPTLGRMLAEEWERYFLTDLLARLSLPERDALTTLAILEEPFWWEMARDLLASPSPNPLPLLTKGQEREGEPATRAGVGEVLSHFLDLSLIQFHASSKVAPWYTLHPVVRDYLLGRLSDDGTRHALHLRAAAYYGQPFVEAARQAVAQSGQTATEEQIESLARNRVVGAWVGQTQNMEHAHDSMNRALAWQNHLFLAEQAYADPAAEIVMAVIRVLDRWGQRDAAKALLRRSIDSREGFARAIAQGNLATLLTDEGRLAEALATYEQVYQTFAALGAKQQMGATLNMQSQVLQDMGDYDQAIERQLASLKIRREINDEEGRAISLHQLSILYMFKEDYDTALQHSQEAEAIDRKRGDMAGLAADLHQQGLFLNRLKRPSEASERFRDSLEINRRIENESDAADSLGELGTLLMDAGQMREAIAAFNEAMEIYQRQGNPKMGFALESLGSVHERQGEYAAALEKYEQAQHIFAQVGMKPDAEDMGRHIARVRGKMGK
jgi:tetratricopeptide (TPR) repeat protein